ncbi:MAG: phenylalanine--tRNA ligase subunit beta [Candidatus Bipolaricaulota bacterium]|nr:phenylalanine--tRNA ligase subunit beta [Candidatus Bipolaricaulota bacterium]
MKVPCRWLAEYVEIDLDRRAVEALADRLTLAGLEVEGIASTGSVRGAVVGRVVAHRPHPRSDHLALCRVDVGTEEAEVVCGAANVVDGATVLLIGVGGELPGGLRIEERKIRGVVSRGMICSKAELGLEERSAGIWNLNERLDLPLGTDVNELFEFDDFVLDIRVTSNRPDCLAVYGIAREVAALTGRDLRPLDLDVRESLPAAGASFSVEVEDPADTPRYAARLMSGIRVGPSPLRLEHRLRKAGMRPLSNVVDVTNYVMLELGHPLHPFDADLVRERIVVRRARAGEAFRTLDGVDRCLSSEALLVTDLDGPMALAGVMGAKRSEIREETTRVLLEIASFGSPTVRRSGRSLGLRTEASLRFERGVDPEGIPLAAARAAHLLQESTGCVVHRGLIDAYPRPREKTTIRLRPSRARSLLGFDLHAERMAEILSRLGAQVRAGDDLLTVGVPTFRADLREEVDLVEEVGRIAGYDRLPSVPPRVPLRLGHQDALEERKDRVRTILAGLGLDEAVTDGFDRADWRSALGLSEEDLVWVRNPMNAGQKALRASLLPGLLAVVETNLGSGVGGGMLFEAGRVFSRSRGETESVAAVLFGRTGIPLRGKEEVSLGLGKGILLDLLVGLGLKRARVAADGVPPSLHSSRGGRVLVEGEPIGLFGELAPSARARFPGEPRVIVFELALLPTESGPRTYAVPPRFPASRRDLSVVLPAERAEENVREAIAAEPDVEGILLYDLYEGEPIAAGHKSLTYELSLRAPDRTLTDAELAAVLERIEKRLGALGVRLRTVGR